MATVGDLLIVQSVDMNGDKVVIKAVFPRIAPDDKQVHYTAPDPYNSMTSFTGSGLPFHSKEQAFSNKMNVGSVTVDGNGLVVIKVTMPNAYYDGFETGSPVIRPYVDIAFTIGGKENGKRVQLNGVPFRLSMYPHPDRTGPEFYKYAWMQPVRSQESILRDSGFPQGYNTERQDILMHGTSANDKPGIGQNFWGLKPPR
jgi:hypothetical protein